MAEGFDLELQDYCSHCGDFDPDVEKIEVSSFGDRAHSYTTTIKCGNAYKCARIYENMREYYESSKFFRTE